MVFVRNNGRKQLQVLSVWAHEDVDESSRAAATAVSRPSAIRGHAPRRTVDLPLAMRTLSRPRHGRVLREGCSRGWMRDGGGQVVGLKAVREIAVL